MSLRLGTHVLLLALILLFAWGLRSFYQSSELSGKTGDTALAAPSTAFPQTALEAMPASTGADLAAPVDTGPDDTGPDNTGPDVAAIDQSIDLVTAGVSRRVRLHTDVPSRSREEVIEYTVKTGDTLFDIAAKFGLKPESVLWANQFVLADNPHSLRPGQVLNILPVDGAYHRWSAGDGLNGVAKFL